MRPNTIGLTTPPNSHSKIYFGEYENIMRIDDNAHNVAKNLVDIAQESIWFYNEHHFNEDILGWNTLDEVSKKLFEKNITYQTIMDSAASNAIPDLIGKCVSGSYWDFLYSWIGTQEKTHSMSYSYLLDTMFGSIRLKEILDTAYTDKYIKNRLAKEVDGYDKLANAMQQYKINPTDNNNILMKKALLEALVFQMIIEHIRFPASFFVTYAIHYSNDFALPNVCKMINQINFDEIYDVY